MNGMNQEAEFTGKLETWKIFRWQHIKRSSEYTQKLLIHYIWRFTSWQLSCNWCVSKFQGRFNFIRLQFITSARLMFPSFTWGEDFAAPDLRLWQSYSLKYFQGQIITWSDWYKTNDHFLLKKGINKSLNKQELNALIWGFFVCLFFWSLVFILREYWENVQPCSGYKGMPRRNSQGCLLFRFMLSNPKLWKAINIRLKITFFFSAKLSKL